jgi:replication factor A1
VDKPDWRYMINVAAADWSGPTLWLSAFGDVVRLLRMRLSASLRTPTPTDCRTLGLQGDKLFGRNSNEMHRLFDESYQEYERITKGVPMTMFLFKLKVAEDRYQEEVRTKCSIVSVSRPSFAEESRKLLDAIGRMARGEPAEPPPPAQGACACACSAAMRSVLTCVRMLRVTGFGGGGGTGGFGAPAPAGGGGSNYFGGGAGGGAAPAYGGGGQQQYGGGGAGGGGGGGRTGSCFKCGGTDGHWAKDCPNAGGGGGGGGGQYGGGGGAGRGGGGGGGGGGDRNKCHKCGGTDGHWCELAAASLRFACGCAQARSEGGPNNLS